METTAKKICRFCFLSSKPLIDIFDDESEANVLEIIGEHVGEVNQYDTLPSYICTECWRRIEDFHHFHQSVLIAQEEYLKRAIKSEIEREPDQTSSLHETTKPPNFVEVITNCEEFNEFDDEIIKVNNDIDDNNQQEVKLKEFDNLGNDTASALDDEESIKVAYNDDDDIDIDEGDDNFYKEENDDQETDSESDCSSSSLKPNDKVDSATKRKIYAENFDSTCDICSTDLKSLKRAIKHYKLKHDLDEGYVKCCGLKFKRDNLVDDHIRLHINPEIFKCKYCHRLMKTRISLSAHQVGCRRPKQYECDICGKIFNRLDKIKTHMITHSRTTVCHICKKTCVNQEKLDYHMKFYHKSDEARKQWQQMELAKKTKLNAETIDDIIATHFNMKCDHCDSASAFKSLQEAQYHYMHEHQIADGYIQCCGAKFKQTSAIEGHVLYHIRPELFVCCICQKESTTTQGLRSHLRLHEMQEIPKENTCTQCNRPFTAKHHLKRHLEMVHGIIVPIKRRSKNASAPDSNAMKSYFDMNCDVCHMQLSSLQHAKLHYLEEHNIPHGYIKCCQLKFKTLKTIKQHLEYHINPNIYKCPICFKTYRRKNTLSTHMTYHKNLAASKFCCDVCGRIYKSKVSLEEHKKSHQDKANRKIPCDQCDKKFVSAQSLQNHILFVHKKDPNGAIDMCEFCGKQFLSRGGVLSHVQTAHQNELSGSGYQINPSQRVSCEICSASFINKYRLKKHIDNVHDGKPVKCTQCDKVAPNASALDCHIKKVHVAQSHQCHLCPKSFKAAVALKDHISTHTGEKTYRCSFCPEAFIWRPNMYAHQKKAHPDEWKALKTQQRK